MVCEKKSATDQSKFRYERFRLIVLSILVFVCIAVLWVLAGTLPNGINGKGRVVLLDSGPASRVASLPFNENKEILSGITDDKYLQTKAFYYLIHKMSTIDDKQLAAGVDRAFCWKNLIKLTERAKVRGKLMRIRSSVLKLARKELNSPHARERGLDGACYWQGAFYPPEGNRPYLFVVTDPPGEIRDNDAIELIAAFFKVWIYQSQTGKQTHAPFFIGKKLRRLPRRPSPVPRYFGLIVAVIMAVTCLGLTAASLHDKKKSAAFRQNFRKRRLNKRREQEKQTEDNQ